MARTRPALGPRRVSRRNAWRTIYRIRPSVATALRRVELCRNDGLHAPSTRQRGYQAWDTLDRWKCSRVFFHRRACGPHLPSPSASARAARWYASGWISWAMSRAWRPIPKAQVADLAMAGIQIDRTKTGVAVRRGGCCGWGPVDSFADRWSARTSPGDLCSGEPMNLIGKGCCALAGLEAEILRVKVWGFDGGRASGRGGGGCHAAVAARFKSGYNEAGRAKGGAARMGLSCPRTTPVRGQSTGAKLSAYNCVIRSRRFPSLTPR
jgi:hypothetical protein